MNVGHPVASWICLMCQCLVVMHTGKLYVKTPGIFTYLVIFHLGIQVEILTELNDNFNYFESFIDVITMT